MRKKERAALIVEALKKEYPEGICSLQYPKPHELLFSVRLSAQCTDERVNQVTPALYARFPTLEAFAEADVHEVEELIHSCGFFRAKAKDIVGAAQMILSDFGGKVPDTMEDLLKLPGVGRKSANLIMGDVFGKPAIVTDTHCIRLVNRMGLVDGIKEPAKVEKELWKIIPPQEGSDFCHRLVEHGRAVCTARTKPYCDRCCLQNICRKAGV